MAMRIILKHSSAEDQRPTVTQAGQAGELLLNTNSAGTFLSCKDSSGDIHQVGGIKISTVAPGNPVKGTVWLDISLGIDRGLLKVYNGSQWITGGGTFDACTDGGLVQDPISGCWSVELSIDDLTDVDTDTNAPAVGEILIWDGTNWVPESLADVQLDWSDLPACAGGGFIYDTSDADAANHCWKIDWSTFPGGENIEWSPADELWNVIDTPPVEISDTAPDFKAEYFWWNSDTGELFLGYKDPSGDEYWVSASRPGDPGADGEDGDPVVISQDTPPPVTEDYIWFDTSSGEAFFGYVDPSGDAYWVSLSKPGAPGADGADGTPVVISQDTAPPVTEDVIWFDTSKGEAFFGYVDPSGDAYWVSLSKPGDPGADGADGTPVVTSSDTAPPVTTDHIWFNTDAGEAFFGYVDPSGDDYWVSLSKPGPPGRDGVDGIGTPGGSNFSVQFNNDGALDGAAGISYVPDFGEFNISSNSIRIWDGGDFGAPSPANGISLRRFPADDFLLNPSSIISFDQTVTSIPIEADALVMPYSHMYWTVSDVGTPQPTRTAEIRTELRLENEADGLTPADKFLIDTNANFIFSTNVTSGHPSSDVSFIFNNTKIKFDSTSPDRRSHNFITIQAPTPSDGDTDQDVTFTLPATDGNAGDVLTTDGSGNLSFATQQAFATISDTAPVNPVDGQIWHNSDAGKSYAYWESQSVWVSM